jgi:hypothetical protein
MRNKVSSFKHYLRVLGLSSSAAPNIRRSCPAILLSLLVLLGASREAPIRLPGHPSPHLAELLLPRHAPAGSYQLATLDGTLEASRDQLRALLAPGAPGIDEGGGAAGAAGVAVGPWKIVREEPLEAFGGGGIYRQSRLSRLYDGRPVRVLRAPIVRDGKVVASLTLYSPRPSEDFSRLVPDTLAILFITDAARR